MKIIVVLPGKQSTKHHVNDSPRANAFIIIELTLSLVSARGRMDTPAIMFCLEFIFHKLLCIIYFVAHHPLQMVVYSLSPCLESAKDN